MKRLDEIRKQYNLESIDDLEKAAREQGVSFEDFKANIRNQIITQEVMRQEVGEHIQMTPGEVERYYEEHKQDYAQPESERLSEILVSTGGGDDPAKVAAAKAKADDIEARLHAGGDFAQLARSFSDGPTASEGGDLGQYKRGQLGKLLEDQDLRPEFRPVHRSDPYAAGLHHPESGAAHAGRTAALQRRSSRMWKRPTT